MYQKKLGQNTKFRAILTNLPKLKFLLKILGQLAALGLVFSCLSVFKNLIIFS